MAVSIRGVIADDRFSLMSASLQIVMGREQTRIQQINGDTFSLKRRNSDTTFSLCFLRSPFT